MKECMGCGACAAICPVDCIVMESDEAGFLYPEVDKEKCINCNRCEAVCPVQHEIPVYGEKEPEAFAAKITEENTLKKSTSGGIFSSLARQWNGVVFGAVMKEDYSVVIEAAEDFHCMQGSKYVQSSTADSYQRVKRYLDERKKVLYTGLPCQIAGLKMFLGKDYDNLLCVDIVCHGSPSMGLFQDYIADLEKQYGPLQEYRFETKRRRWSPAIEKEVYFKAGDTAYYRDFTEDSFLFSFCKEESYRSYCYDCKFSSMPRVSDITIGDFFGYGMITPKKINPKAGISMVLVNTEKGEEVWNALPNVDRHSVSLYSCLIVNHNLWKPTGANKKSEKFYDVYKSQGYSGIKEDMMKRSGNVPVRIKKWIRHLFPSVAAGLMLREKKKQHKNVLKVIQKIKEKKGEESEKH